MKIKSPRLKKQFKNAIAAVEKEARDAHKIYGQEDGDGMKKMFEGDASDLREVYRFWTHGQNSRAYDKASDMDTAARDNIPIAVWRDILRRIR